MRTLLNLSHSRCYNELSGEREGTTVVRDPRRASLLVLGVGLGGGPAGGSLGEGLLVVHVGACLLDLGELGLHEDVVGGRRALDLLLLLDGLLGRLLGGGLLLGGRHDCSWVCVVVPC